MADGPHRRYFYLFFFPLENVQRDARMLVRSGAMLMSRATPTHDISSYIAGKYATTQRERVKLAAPVERGRARI